ncbi:protein SEH1-like isoform X2 [Camellia sinensis]|uniref:protein SEH1-like isoform X2 n=1 Tax=Camellia sinensis TaxID=4442 RepID=UPI001036B60D|nr:protein SEH1-like isoform X2 [Camellia sinensis]
MQLNSAKVWEFDQDHQRWLPVDELALPEDKGDPVYAVAWAPNIGRPYEVIAVATHKGIAIWHLGLNPDLDGRLSEEVCIALWSCRRGLADGVGHEWNDTSNHWKRRCREAVAV